ncbi:MAG: hypothetical protein ACYC6G_12855 [Desulfobaccales bacterium]
MRQFHRNASWPGEEDQFPVTEIQDFGLRCDAVGEEVRGADDGGWSALLCVDTDKSHTFIDT